MTREAATIDRQWWKEAVVYQIYPRSFNDTDGDGVGDIPGIIEKVDYLEDLGVEVVWLCPVYDSPQADMGYDIRDYRAIDDQFGDLEDWETLLDELHDRDIKLIMDLVVNHTSDEHEWFQQSRRREGKYEEYYHWRDGDPGEPPNNWTSFFGGPAWSYDEERGQWYLHLFDEKQPDLNWRNPDVRADVKEMITWWLEKGIDGFRMDVINLLSKVEGLPNGDPDPKRPDWPIGNEYFVNGPRIHEYLRGLYDEVFSNYDVMTVGEMIGLTPQTAGQFLGPDADGLNMAIHFDHVNVDYQRGNRWSIGEWNLTDLKEIFEAWQTEVAEADWEAIYWENHDQPRSVSRFGDVEEYHFESATLLATFLMAHRGTPYVYQGEEIGMTNADFETLEECRDVATINQVEMAIESGQIDDYEEIRPIVNYRSRDNGRTPVQWSSEEHAGFTDGEPWIKVNQNYPQINVADQRGTAGSIWEYYRALIDLRNDEDVLIYGEYDLLRPEDEQLYAIVRTLGDERALVVLNWTDEANECDLSEDVGQSSGSVMIANDDDVGTDLAALELAPYDARIYRLS
ncbi:MAG: glycoside hydrolase family 13 protein [Halorhabdus sp.]